VEGASAIDLGREILNHFGGFRRMADADLAEWRQIKGLGTAKTASLIAAVEIARRFWAEPSVPSMPIKCASQVLDLFGPHAMVPRALSVGLHPSSERSTAVGRG